MGESPHARTAHHSVRKRVKTNREYFVKKTGAPPGRACAKRRKSLPRRLLTAVSGAIASLPENPELTELRLRHGCSCQRT